MEYGMGKMLPRIFVHNARDAADRLDGLLLGCENHLFTLAPARHSALLAMLPNILLSSFDGRKLLSLDLSCFIDGLRQMTMTLDSSDLRHMRVSLDQCLIVLELLPLACALDAAT